MGTAPREPGGKIHIIKIGDYSESNREVNIREILPSIYSRLTSENFFEVPVKLRQTVTSNNSMNYTRDTTLQRASYNADTGILKLYPWKYYTGVSGVGSTSATITSRVVYCVY